MVAAWLILLWTAGCRQLPPTVTIDDECVAEYGMSCDWLASLDAAATRPCSGELDRHWSAEVRRVCVGEDRDSSIGFGNFDVHFAEDRAVALELTGEIFELDTQPDKLRPFRFDAQADGRIELSSERHVSTVVETRIGVLAGVNAGEWGGALDRFEVLPRPSSQGDAAR